MISLAVWSGAILFARAILFAPTVDLDKDKDMDMDMGMDMEPGIIVTRTYIAFFSWPRIHFHT
jgi:hypothetical protein